MTNSANRDVHRAAGVRGLGPRSPFAETPLETRIDFLFSPAAFLRVGPHHSAGNCLPPIANFGRPERNLSRLHGHKSRRRPQFSSFVFRPDVLLRAVPR